MSEGASSIIFYTCVKGETQQMKARKIIGKILGGTICMIAGMGLSLIWFVLGLAFRMSADEAIKKAEVEEKEVSDDE